MIGANVVAKVAILCVDDETIVLDSLRYQLQSAFGDKYLYEWAESAQEALEVIEELYLEGTRVVVIISDWLMPGMKGDEFLIKVHEQHPDIIKIMLTGHADEEAIERSRQYANLECYFTKPWDGQQLIAAIRSALARLPAGV